MADEATEAAEQVSKCVKWSQGWAETNPDPVVADAIGEGLVTLGCLPKSRLRRMLSNGTLEPETLTEGQMQFLNQKGLLDPEEVETVDNGDSEEEADGVDDGGGMASLDDLDEEARERLISEMEERIEKRVAEMRASDADDGADGDDVDEETGQEAETADDGDEEAEKADGGGDGDDSIRTASQAM
jgi:hypothetical protein